MTRADKERFASESLARDLKIKSEQDARRDKMYGEVKEGESRGATKKTREEMEERERRRQEGAMRSKKVVSEEEMKKRAEKKRKKKEKQDEINRQMEVLKKDKAKQAKKRLDFLLKQSDIFSHFGKVVDPMEEVRLDDGRRRDGGEG